MIGFEATKISYEKMRVSSTCWPVLSWHWICWQYKLQEPGWIHPNLNLENPDKELDPEVLVGTKKERFPSYSLLTNEFHV
ncbi:3-oxoacyl-[acyl-carrier-protein] synthase II [Melia azedarach]|uniref:3-oxoacyl-[acyl-carrier-protein] synthase II n=1 Tax=Melia azedarach TaxID=155640 RepID=A0ACC1Y3H8_MELAZ|nr:3-oxoacyl-[acyl-carrier-protein] synthase II [Melia azedarach]